MTHPPCPTCGAVADRFRIPMWETPSEYDTEPPDYIGCIECHTMHALNAHGELES